MSLLDLIWGCSHENTTWPQTVKRDRKWPPGLRTYIVCTDCGREFGYSWQEMRVITMDKYWVGQLGASFVVYSPDREIVAFRPDQESAEKTRDALNAQLRREELQDQAWADLGHELRRMSKEERNFKVVDIGEVRRREA